MQQRYIGLTVAVAMGFAAGSASAEPPAGFDYYVLAISWTPGWCEIEGAARGDDRCAAGAGIGWSLHGLWPQFEGGGWPEFCSSLAREPSRAQTAAMADVMGSSGLAWHQWRKHGRCTGLAAYDYFSLSRQAFAMVRLPAALQSPEAALQVAPDALAREFAGAIAGASAEDVTVLCRGPVIREVRVCLTTDLAPRPCGPDVAARACTRPDATLLPPS